MRIFLRPSFLFALPLLCVLAFAADKAPDKPAKLALEDVIFDANYLRQMLGPKTLLCAETKSKEITPELPRLLTASGLGQATRFFAFPDGATWPELYYSIPYRYPQSVRVGILEGSADFVALVGTDGRVKCVYCYRHTDRIFALVSAAAIIRWRFEPAKINGTAVPVLVDLPTSYRGDSHVERMMDIQKQNARENMRIQIPQPPKTTTPKK